SGPTYSIQGCFSYPAVAVDQPYTAIVHWGYVNTDVATVGGTLVPYSTLFRSGGHTYAQSGVYSVTVSVTDKDGGTGTSPAATVTVANVAPSVSAPTVNPTSSNEGAGTAFTVSGTFTDPAGALDQPFTAVVSWG